MQRVAVTGAAGFIGRAIGARLRAAGHEVVRIDRTGTELEVLADILGDHPWPDALAGCDTIVHTAALVGMPADASDFWRVNTLGTVAMIRAARDSGVRRFVLLSSVTVFGNRFPDGVTEDHPVVPTGVPYADSKIAAEHAVLAAHVAGDIDAVIVRPGDVYGRHSRPWTLIPLEMIRTRRAAVPAMGRGIHSPIYIDDLVTGVVAAAQHPAASGRIYTLSGGTGVPVGEYMDHYAAMVGRGRVPRVPTSVALAAAAAQAAWGRRTGRVVELSPAAVRYLAERRGTYSVARAARELGWHPEVSLAEGMARIERELRSQGLL